MGVDGAVDACLVRLRATVQDEGRRSGANLYGIGLTAKMEQADFALRRLSRFKGLPDEARASIDPDEPTTVGEQVHFYLDAFWACLYSTLDILAQFVNHAMPLGKDEKDVNFKMILKELADTRTGTAIQSRFEECRKSDEFCALVDYRNCSTHRRQIFVGAYAQVSLSVTKGYGTATGKIREFQRLLCDNPGTLEPTVNETREIPQYLREMKDKIAEHIERMLESVVPIA